jgi:hypothetical protein
MGPEPILEGVAVARSIRYLERTLMKLIFTLSAGRTGTAFLAELFVRNFPGAEVYHERMGYDAFGVDTPDLSHLTLFNSRGNILKVQRFWEQKLGRILRSPVDVYAETSHVLMKAGLVENAVRLCRGHELHFIRLRRAAVPTLLSYERRGDFLNKGNQWLWYLDEGYPRNFIKPEVFRQFGLHGLGLWYLMEVDFRAAYYEERHQGNPGVFFHETDIDDLNNPARVAALLSAVHGEHHSDGVEIPGKKNVSKALEPPDPEHLRALEKLVAGTKSLKPRATAREYVLAGVDPFAPCPLPQDEMV